MASSGEDVQITCRFVTRLPEKFRIAPTPLAVPGALTRYGLSEVVNHLLALDPPKPFDFLVDGELVRTSLQKLLLRQKISAEKTLDVEYIPAVGPPSHKSTGQHEDWVSAVDGGFAGALATGCYDGTAKLWSANGVALLSVAVPNARSNAVTSVALLPAGGGEKDATTHELALVAGAHDGVARAWDASVSRDGKASARPSRVFVGHTGSIAEIAAAPGGDSFATASSDGTARVWRRDGGAPFDFGDAEPESRPSSGEPQPRASLKRRKARKGLVASHVPGAAPARSCLDFDATESADGPLAPLGAELVLGDHRGGVTCVGWESPEAVWSGGDDKTLKRWDADSGACTQSFDAPKAVASLAVRADGARVLWCGGGDRGVHAWDPRAGQTTGGIATFASHQVRFFFLSVARRARARDFLIGPFFPRKNARRATSVTRPSCSRRAGTRSRALGEQISNFFPRRPRARFSSTRAAVFSSPKREARSPFFLFAKTRAASRRRDQNRASRRVRTAALTANRNPDDAGDGRVRALVSRERAQVRVLLVRRDDEAVGRAREAPAAHGDRRKRGREQPPLRRRLPRPRPRGVRRHGRRAARLRAGRRDEKRRVGVGSLCDEKSRTAETPRRTKRATRGKTSPRAFSTRMNFLGHVFASSPRVIAS